MKRANKHTAARGADAASWLPWIGALTIAIAAIVLVARWAPWKQQAGGGASAASVAVLPFASFSEGKEDEYFADGLTEEVIHSLAQVPGLKVAARTSAFYFKGRNEDLRDVGRRLGVSHVVEGSVRREGTRMRMVAQLIKVDDGFHLWSRTYERNVSDTFAVQTEIAVCGRRCAATEAEPDCCSGSRARSRASSRPRSRAPGAHCACTDAASRTRRDHLSA